MQETFTTGGAESPRDSRRRRELKEYIGSILAKNQESAPVHLLETVFGKQFNSLVRQWFSKREAAIKGEEAAEETKWHEYPLPETVEAESEIVERHVPEVFFIPGQFNMSHKVNADAIHEAMHERHPFVLHAPERLYSALDNETIESFIEEIAERVRGALETSAAPVVLVGFSFGGMLAKKILDEVTTEYPGRVGLVTLHSPLDPEVGFLVRHASFGEIYTALGVSTVHEGKYPFIALAGSEDGVVTCASSISVIGNRKTLEDVLATAGKITPKVTAGTSHHDPLGTIESRKRVLAAVEACGKYAGEFPNDGVERVGLSIKGVHEEASETKQRDEAA